MMWNNMKYIIASRVCVFTVSVFCILGLGYSQTLSSVFILKEKRKITADTIKPFTIVKGKIFYNHQSKVMIYSIIFPEKEIWVISDTNLWHIKDGKVIEKKTTIPVVESSVFALSIDGVLPNFGLEKNKLLKPVKIENKDSLVVTRWQQSMGKKAFGDVLTARHSKSGLLHSVIIYDVNERMVARYFFENYLNVEGYAIPSQMVQFYYIFPDKKAKENSGEYIRVINFYDITILKNPPDSISRPLEYYGLKQ